MSEEVKFYNIESFHKLVRGMIKEEMMAELDRLRLEVDAPDELPTNFKSTGMANKGPTPPGMKPVKPGEDVHVKDMGDKNLPDALKAAIASKDQVAMFTNVNKIANAVNASTVKSGR